MFMDGVQVEPRRRAVNSDSSAFCRGERGYVFSCLRYDPLRCAQHLETCSYAQVRRDRAAQGDKTFPEYDFTL